MSSFPISPPSRCYLKPNETTCRVVLILTANIYKNKQPQQSGAAARPGDTSLSQPNTRNPNFSLLPLPPASPLGHSFLFKYSRGRLIIAPFDFRLLCQRRYELELELEQLLPNPIIIALIKNKFSILAPFVESPLVVSALSDSVAANFANMAI